MRSLKPQHKAILDRYHVFGADELPAGVWESLEEIGDYETLWMDVNRYLSDRWFELSLRRDW